ncbi:lipopolysaccharide biosynthesis protein [Vibrio cholerae]|uniref:lipopolysaccharide biosynthesis protein n=1 Tax=Vibrio cholerae TaxID=666 RepID=UPI001158DE1E|nr:oligosaccharide flippase family protein [Vibrio cholerae]TQP19744.1 oligosaccharide flippase family protein [Vibrio cholerae]
MNKSIRNKLFRKGSIFLFANILNAAIPFLLLPVLTRFLTPEDYGMVTMFTVFLSLVNTFVGLNAHGAINIQYFKLDAKRFSEYVTSCLFLLVISAAIVFLIVLVFGRLSEEFIGLPHKWMLIAVGVSFFQFLITIRLAIWVVTGLAIEYGALQVSQTFVNAGFSLFFIFFFGMFWEGRLLGQVIASAVFGLVALLLITKSGLIVKPSNIKADIRHALFFGLPLIPHVLGGFLMISTDRIIITSVVDIAASGVYMVGLQLGLVIAILADSFNKVYAPWIMRNLSNAKLDKVELVKNSYLVMCAFLLMGLAWGLVAVFLLPLLVGEQFLAAGAVITYMCLGHSCTALYYIVTNYIFYSEKTKLLAVITFSIAMLNLPVTYFFVKNYGITGAAVAFMFVQALLFFLTWFLSNKVFPMPWLFFLKGKKNA